MYEMNRYETRCLGSGEGLETRQDEGRVDVDAVSCAVAQRVWRASGLLRCHPGVPAVPFANEKEAALEERGK